MTEIIKIQHTSWADTSIAPPAFQTHGAAGADLRANLPLEMRKFGVEIDSGSWKLIPLGLIIEVPIGFEGQIRPRSGLALKFGVTVLNAPGTIDCDYRGEVGVVLINHGASIYTIAHGDRIAQLVVAPIANASYEWTRTILSSARGTGGFGSTGQN